MSNYIHTTAVSGVVASCNEMPRLVEPTAAGSDDPMLGPAVDTAFTCNIFFMNQLFILWFKVCNSLALTNIHCSILMIRHIKVYVYASTIYLGF